MVFTINHQYSGKGINLADGYVVFDISDCCKQPSDFEFNGNFSSSIFLAA